MCVVRISGTYSCLFLIESLRCKSCPCNSGFVLSVGLATSCRQVVTKLHRLRPLAEARHKALFTSSVERNRMAGGPPELGLPLAGEARLLSHRRRKAPSKLRGVRVQDSTCMPESAHCKRHGR